MSIFDDLRDSQQEPDVVSPYQSGPIEKFAGEEEADYEFTITQGNPLPQDQAPLEAIKERNAQALEEQRKLEEKNLIDSVLDRAMDEDQEQNDENKRVATELDVPLERVEIDPIGADRELRKKQAHEILENNPDISEIMKDPEMASKLKNIPGDLENLSWWGQFKKDIANQWEVGKMERELYTKEDLENSWRLEQYARTGARTGRLSEMQRIKNRTRMEELDAMIDGIHAQKDPDDFFDSPAAGFLGETAKIVGQMAGGLDQIISGGIGGYMTGSAAAQIAGPGARMVVPFLLAGPSAPVTAPALGLITATGLAGTAIFEDARRIERGAAIRELRESGFEPEIVENVSHLVGWVNGTLELIGVGLITKPVKKAITLLIAKKAKIGTISKKEAIAIGLATWVKSMGGEAGTEVLQEIWNKGMYEFARIFDPKRIPSKLNTLEEWWQAAIDIGTLGLKVFAGMAPLGLPGAYGTYRGESRRVDAANKYQTQMEALAGNAQANEMLEEDHKELVEKMTEDGPIKDVYVKVEKLNEVYQEETEAVMEELGVADEYENAADTDGFVKIPIGTYTAKIARNPEAHEKLSMHSKWDLEAYTPAEAKIAREEAAENIESEFNKAVEDTATTEEDAVVVEQIREAIHREQVENGRPEEDAALIATLEATSVLVGTKRMRETNPEMTVEEFATNFGPKLKFTEHAYAPLEMTAQEHFDKGIPLSMIEELKANEMDSIIVKADPELAQALGDGQYMEDQVITLQTMERFREQDQELETGDVRTLEQGEDLWDYFYETTKGEFWRGESTEGAGVGLGALGRGIYITDRKGMADFFATQHPSGVVNKYKVKPGLKLIDSLDDEFINIKKEMGLESWEYSDDPVYSNILTSRLKELGYDGVVSSKPAEGIVIFDEDNVELIKPSEQETLEQSAVPIMRKPIKIKGTGKGGQVLNWDLGEALTKRHMEKYGRVLDPTDPKDYKILLNDMGREYENQLKEHDTGTGWYVDDIKSAIETTTLIIPELEKVENRELFLTMAAILSNQQNPVTNWENTVLAMQGFVKDGKIPLLKPNGKNYGVTASKQGLQVLQSIIDKHGLPGALTWLRDTHTGKELAEMRQASGAYKEGMKLTGYLADETNLKGIYIGMDVTGPKVSKFMQNNMGMQNVVTVDLWLARTYNRLMGRILEVSPKAKKKKEIISAVRGIGERKVIQQLITDIAEKYNEQPSAVQAALWYFEQRLYANHGIQTEKRNFSGAADIAAKKRSIALPGGREDVSRVSDDVLSRVQKPTLGQGKIGKEVKWFQAAIVTSFQKWLDDPKNKKKSKIPRTGEEWAQIFKPGDNPRLTKTEIEFTGILEFFYLHSQANSIKDAHDEVDARARELAEGEGSISLLPSIIELRRELLADAKAKLEKVSHPKYKVIIPPEDIIEYLEDNYIRINEISSETHREEYEVEEAMAARGEPNEPTEGQQILIHENAEDLYSSKLDELTEERAEARVEKQAKIDYDITVETKTDDALNWIAGYAKALKQNWEAAHATNLRQPIQMPEMANIFKPLEEETLGVLRKAIGKTITDQQARAIAVLAHGIEHDWDMFSVYPKTNYGTERGMPSDYVDISHDDRDYPGTVDAFNARFGEYFIPNALADDDRTGTTSAMPYYEPDFDQPAKNIPEGMTEQEVKEELFRFHHGSGSAATMQGHVSLNFFLKAGGFQKVFAEQFAESTTSLEDVKEEIEGTIISRVRQEVEIEQGEELRQNALVIATREWHEDGGLEGETEGTGTQYEHSVQWTHQDGEDYTETRFTWPGMKKHFMRMPPQARAIQAKIETFFNTTQTIEGRTTAGTLVGGVDYAAWAKNDLVTALEFIREVLNMVASKHIDFFTKEELSVMVGTTGPVEVGKELAKFLTKDELKYLQKHGEDRFYIQHFEPTTPNIAERDGKPYLKLIFESTPPNTFLHGHWGKDQNVVTHLRFDTRELLGPGNYEPLSYVPYIQEIQRDPGYYDRIEPGDGLLYINELQSDWEQGKREKEHRQKLLAKKARYDALKPLTKEEFRDWLDGKVEETPGLIVRASKTKLLDDELDVGSFTKEEVSELLGLAAKVNQKEVKAYLSKIKLTTENEKYLESSTGKTDKVFPEMPFLDKRAWVALGVKRIIAKAIWLGGTPRLEWTTGAQQSLRSHDLEKWEAVMWNPKTQRLYKKMRGEPQFVEASQNVAGEKDLVKIIPKQQAKRLMEAPTVKDELKNLKKRTAKLKRLTQQLKQVSGPALAKKLGFSYHTGIPSEFSNIASLSMLRNPNEQSTIKIQPEDIESVTTEPREPYDVEEVQTDEGVITKDYPVQYWTIQLKADQDRFIAFPPAPMRLGHIDKTDGTTTIKILLGQEVVKNEAEFMAKFKKYSTMQAESEKIQKQLIDLQANEFDRISTNALTFDTTAAPDRLEGHDDARVIMVADIDVAAAAKRNTYDVMIPSVIRDLFKKYVKDENGKPVVLTDEDLNLHRAEEVNIDQSSYGGYTPGKQPGVNLRPLIEAMEVLKEEGKDSRFELPQEKKGGERRAIFQYGDITKQESLIILLEKADHTSYFHEMGHFYFEQLRHMAMSPNAPQGILDDMDTILKWIDPEMTRAKWNAMKPEHRAAGHEQFARGYEAYLYEGKAPSSALRAAFRRFHQWMKMVYKSIQQLNVTLTPEVRNVFDRILATDEEIATAREEKRMTPMFENNEVVRMNPELWGRYVQLTSQSQEEAEDELRVKSLKNLKWLRGGIKRMTAQAKRDIREKRDAIKKEMEFNVASRQVYQAIRWLRQPVEKKEKIKSHRKNVTPAVDSLFVAIHKLGGISKAELIKFWGMDKNAKLYGRVANPKDGLTIDAMGILLSQDDYLTLDEDGRYDPHELETKFFEELSGRKQYSTQNERYQASEFYEDEFMRSEIDNLSLEDISHAKISIESLIAEFGDTEDAIWKRLPTGKWGLVADHENTISADFAAKLLGYGSASELIHQLAGAKPMKEVIEQDTDQKMLEIYGQLGNQESIDKAVDDALHNEARTRAIHIELGALSKLVGKSTVLAKAAKEWAEERISRMPIMKIKPHEFTIAEKRANRLSEQALKRGNLEEAADHKRAAVLNHHFARAAINALKEVDKTIRHFKRLDSKGARKAIATEYMIEIDKLLTKYDIRRSVTIADIKRRETLKSWIESEKEKGNNPVVDSRLTGEIDKKHFRQIPMEELRGLRDTIKNIEHLGRLKNNLLLAKEKREFNDIINDLVTSITVNSSKKEIEDKDRILGANNPEDQKGKDWHRAVAEHRKFANLGRVMDGLKEGPFWEYLTRRMNERADVEATMMENANEKLGSLFNETYSFSDWRKIYKRQWYEEVGVNLSRSELIMIALNQGNEINRMRVLDGYRTKKGEQWSQEQVDSLLETLDEKDWHFVMGMWEYFETYWPAIRDKELRVTGLSPEKVQGMPVKTKFGMINEDSRVGYFPISFDTSKDTKPYDNMAADAAKQMKMGALSRATTKRGHIEARILGPVDRHIRADFGVIFEHVQQVIHDLSWHEWLIDTNKIMMDESFRGAVIKHYGYPTLNALMDTVTDVASGDVVSSESIERKMNTLRAGVSVAMMGWNLGTALLQPMGLLQSAVRLGYKGMSHALLQITKNPVKAINGIYEKSVFMRLRSKTMNREINEIRNKIGGQGMFPGLRSGVEDSYFYLIAKMQLVADAPTWLAAYEIAQSENMDEPTSIAKADQAVIDSQGSGHIKDLAHVQRGSPIKKLFTNFMSYFQTTFNLTADSWARTNFRSASSVAHLGVDMIMLYTIPILLEEIVRGALIKGECDGGNDWACMREKIIRDHIAYPISGIIFARELNAIIQGWDYEGPAGTRIYNEIGKLTKQIGQKEADAAFWKSANKTLGIWKHYPALQVERVVEGFVALEEGDTENVLAPLFGYAKNR